MGVVGETRAARRTDPSTMPRMRAYVPGGLDVLTITDRRVADVVAFLAADLTRFGLPKSLPG
jgi:hypothetical protein